MTNEEAFHTIKSTVNEFLPGAQVFVFGSRARKEFDDKGSDFDVLIITEKNYAPREKMSWESIIRKALVWSLNAPFDIILQSKNEVARYKNSKGSVIYYALKDALEL